MTVMKILKLKWVSWGIENERVIIDYQSLLNENQKFSLLVNAWNKSSIYLEKIQELHKQLRDKTGLGFSNNESTSDDTSTQSHLTMCKGKYIHFVKSSAIFEHDEPELQVENIVN